MIYLDSASTTKIDDSVLGVMMPYLREQYMNPGSMHSGGMAVRSAVGNARKQVADFIGAEPEQIVFTSGGSEANSMALIGLSDHLRAMNKMHVIISKIEHDSVLKAAERLKELGFDITYIDVMKDGTVPVRALEDLIREDTGLVSVMYVNNEIGSVNYVNDIGALCSSAGILFHTDCVQAAGSFQIDVDKIKCDLLSLSSHKLHGPKGCGALFVRDKSVISPIVLGGSDQEFGLRGGTENVPCIIGFGIACEIARSEFGKNVVHTSVLKQLFLSEFLEKLPAGMRDGVRVNGRPVQTSGKVLNIMIPGVDGQSLLLMMDNHGIAISTGSACRSLYTEPSHVLNGIGLTDEEARRCVRVSFSKFNTKEEVVEAADTMAMCSRMLCEGALWMEQ